MIGSKLVSAQGIIFFCVFSAYLVGPAIAQMSLSPTIAEVEAYPGSSKTFTLSVSNTGSELLNCSVRVSSLEVLAGGLPAEVEDATRSCRDWITVESEQFPLLPEKGIRLVCRIKPPREANGGYYAMISCHGKPSSQGDESQSSEGLSGGVRFSHKVVAVVMLTVPAARMQAIVEPGQPGFLPVEGGDAYALTVPVRNCGNIHDRVAGNVEIRSEAGQLVDEFKLTSGRGFLLPGHERLFTNDVGVNLPDGVYVAAIRLLRGKSRQTMRNAFGFYVKDGTPEIGEISDEMRRNLGQKSVGFIISPQESTLDLRPGARRAQPVVLTNLTEETIRVRAAAMEWVRSSDRQNLVSRNTPSHSRSGRNLLVLKTPEIELRPLAKRRVSLMVAMPRDASGEYYGAVTFDRAATQLSEDPAQLARRSVLVSARVQGTGTSAAEIADFNAARTPNGAVEFETHIVNTGNLGVFPDISISIQNQTGGSVGKITNPEARSSLIQAGGECTVKTMWNQVLDPGTYTGVLTLRYDPNMPPLSKRTQFEVLAPIQTSPAAAPNQRMDG